MDSLNNQPLISIIRNLIDCSPLHSISFCTYMEYCLYEPQYGYYSRKQIKIGKNGDFYTSSSIGRVMGRMLARYLQDWQCDYLQFGEQLNVVEWGGGDGMLALHILDELLHLDPHLYERTQYVMIERSEFHRHMAQKVLQRHDKQLRFLTEEEWEEDKSFRAQFIFANELLDAFPVHRIRKLNGVIHEIYVAWEEQEQCFKECLLPLDSSSLREILNGGKLSLLEGQTVEVCPGAYHWIAKVAKTLTFGQLVTIDYGDIAQEIHAAHRMNGTLMCYRKHQASDDPYRYAGRQDMTSHVNFTDCIRAGEAAGFTGWELKTQKQFLVDAGILQLLADNPGGEPFNETARQNRAVRQLLLSDQMSELFKVLIQTKKRRNPQ